MVQNLAPSPFDGQNLASLIDLCAGIRGDKIALIWAPFDSFPQQWTYAELRKDVRRVAAGLQTRGLGVGDRVIVHSNNDANFILSWLGCAYAGVVPVTTNTRSTVEELRYFSDKTGASGVITQTEFAPLVAEACRDIHWIVLSDRQDSIDGFQALLGDPNMVAAAPVDPQAAFGIQFTSGTTSRPKAVLWTHANALWGGCVSAVHEGLRAEDVHLVTMPLFHTNAQVYSVLSSLWVGATIVLQPRFSASRFWDISVRHGCTWASMIPFCVRALAAIPVPEKHCYRLWGSGVCEPDSDSYFGVKTIGWWGMTETVAHGFVGNADRPNEPMSIGRVSPFYEVEVRREDGTNVVADETGELFIRGRSGMSLFAGYYDDARATKNAYDNRGFFKTGDLVTRHESGFYAFSDRAKDMLKVGGENVAASEVEGVIANVVGVKEVAVVGAPHLMLDEVPTAFVVVAEAADELIVRAKIEAACIKTLSAFKRPRAILFVNRIPKGTLEKVNKAELRTRVMTGMAWQAQSD